MYTNVGTKFVSCSADKTLRVWCIDGPLKKTSHWVCECTLSGYHSRTIYSVEWCPITNLIATACEDNAIRIFTQTTTTTNNNQLDHLYDSTIYSLGLTMDNAHNKDVNCVSWNSKQAGDLISCSDDGTIKYWNISQIH